VLRDNLQRDNLLDVFSFEDVCLGTFAVMVRGSNLRDWQDNSGEMFGISIFFDVIA